MDMKRGFGCIDSPSDLRDYRINKSIRVELPQEFQIAKTTIKNQGVVGSCVAHAMSSVLEHYNHIFSTGWIYGYRPDGYYQGTGMCVRDALKTLNKVGGVLQQDFPYNVEMSKAKTLVDDRLEDLKLFASQYKIDSYVRLYSEDEIKQFIYNNKRPVPFSIKTEYLALDKDNVIKVPEDFTNATGHMMLILGWNEKGFIIQNSWGIGWGDNGCAILPYDYKIVEAWGIILEGDAESDVAKKPILYFIRKILQKILNFISSL